MGSAPILTPVPPPAASRLQAETNVRSSPGFYSGSNSDAMVNSVQIAPHPLKQHTRAVLKDDPKNVDLYREVQDLNAKNTRPVDLSEVDMSMITEV